MFSFLGGCFFVCVFVLYNWGGVCFWGKVYMLVCAHTARSGC